MDEKVYRNSFGEYKDKSARASESEDKGTEEKKVCVVVSITTVEAKSTVVSASISSLAEATSILFFTTQAFPKAYLFSYHIHRQHKIP